MADVYRMVSHLSDGTPFAHTWCDDCGWEHKDSHGHNRLWMTVLANPGTVACSEPGCRWSSPPPSEHLCVPAEWRPLAELVIEARS